MEKIFNNQGELARRLDSKTGRFFIAVPDFYKDDNGNYVVLDELIQINNKKDFEDYIAKHQEIIEFLGANYPKLVSAVYKNTMTSFTDPFSRTTFAKIFSGKPVKNTEIYQEAHATDVRSIFSGFIKTYNAQNMGLEGTSVPLPLVKRTSSQFLKLFMDEKQGFLVPEIDANGLVVNATNSRDDLNVKLIAVPSNDITYDQLFDYLAAPFGDKLEESGVDFEQVHQLCFDAYKHLGQNEMAESIEKIVDYCMSVYPLSFTRVKADRPSRLVETPTENTPPTEPLSEDDPVEEFEERYNVVISKIPRSKIKDMKGNDKYFSGVKSVKIEKEMVKKELEA